MVATDAGGEGPPPCRSGCSLLYLSSLYPFPSLLPRPNRSSKACSGSTQQLGVRPWWPEMKGGGAAARLLPACAFPFAVERVAVKKLCDGALLPEPKTVSCG